MVIVFFRPTTPHFVVKQPKDEPKFFRAYRFWLSFIENNANKIAFLTLFLLITMYLFMDTAMSNENFHCNTEVMVHNKI